MFCPGGVKQEAVVLGDEHYSISSLRGQLCTASRVLGSREYNWPEGVALSLHLPTILVALAARQERKVDAGTNTRITLTSLPCLSLPLHFTPALVLRRGFTTRLSPIHLPFTPAAGSQSLVINLLKSHHCTFARHANTSKRIIAQYSYFEHSITLTSYSP